MTEKPHTRTDTKNISSLENRLVRNSLTVGLRLSQNEILLAHSFCAISLFFLLIYFILYFPSLSNTIVRSSTLAMVLAYKCCKVENCRLEAKRKYDFVKWSTWTMFAAVLAARQMRCGRTYPNTMYNCTCTWHILPSHIPAYLHRLHTNTRTHSIASIYLFYFFQSGTGLLDCIWPSYILSAD